MKVNRIRNPATIVPGAQWINGLDTIGQLSSAPAPEPTPEPEPMKLPPLPPIDHEREKRWGAACDLAEAVLVELQGDPDFDPKLLLGVVEDIVGGKYTGSDIVAVYRHRKWING